MAMQLTRKSWESHKAWTVTGKGLSAAIDAFTEADAKAQRSLDQDDYRAALGHIQTVGDEINKNLAKINKAIYKDTVKVLNDLYTLAKSRSDALKVESAKTLKTEGARKIVVGAREDLAKVEAFVAANKPEGVQKQVKFVVDSFLKSPKGTDKDEAKKFKQKVETGPCAKWFKAIASAELTSLNIGDQLKMVKCDGPAVMQQAATIRKEIKTLVETKLDKPVRAMKVELARLDLKN